MLFIKADGCSPIVCRVQIQPSIAKFYCVSLKRIMQCCCDSPASLRRSDIQSLNLAAFRKLPHHANCDASDHLFPEPSQPDPRAVFEIQSCKLVSRITRHNARGFVILLNDLIRSVDLYRCRSFYFEIAHCQFHEAALECGGLP